MSNTNERHLAFEWLRSLPLVEPELTHATVILEELVRLNQSIEVFRTEKPLSELSLEQKLEVAEKQRDYFESSHLMTLKELNGLHEKIKSLEKAVNKADVYFSTNWYATNLPIANESKALESLLTDIDEALAQHNIEVSDE